MNKKPLEIDTVNLIFLLMKVVMNGTNFIIDCTNITNRLILENIFESNQSNAVQTNDVDTTTICKLILLNLQGCVRTIKELVGRGKHVN